MYYVNPIIKSFLRTNQPEGRGKYVRLDQNENPDGIPQWLFDKAKENNALVIVDEAYYLFHKETALPLLKEYDNLVILRTFSKTLSMPGLRVGVVISSAENAQYIRNYKFIRELYEQAEKDDKHDFIYADLVAIYYGKRIYFSKGFTNNIKITRKEDIPLCKSLMKFSEEDLFNS